MKFADIDFSRYPCRAYGEYTDGEGCYCIVGVMAKECGYLVYPQAITNLDGVCQPRVAVLRRFEEFAQLRGEMLLKICRDMIRNNDAGMTFEKNRKQILEEVAKCQQP